MKVARARSFLSGTQVTVVAATAWKETVVLRTVGGSSQCRHLRWPVLNPRILCGVDFPSSIGSSSTFHHSDYQRPLEATVPRGSAALFSIRDLKIM